MNRSIDVIYVFVDNEKKVKTFPQVGFAHYVAFAGSLSPLLPLIILARVTSANIERQLFSLIAGCVCVCVFVYVLVLVLVCLHFGELFLSLSHRHDYGQEM